MESESKESGARKKHAKLKIGLKGRRQRAGSKYESATSAATECSDTDDQSTSCGSLSAFACSCSDPPPRDTVVYQVPCTVYFEQRCTGGDLIITRRSVVFAPRQSKGAFWLEIPHDDIVSVAKASKKGVDKGISILTSAGSVSVYGLKQRFKVLYFIDVCRANGASYGLSANDETEVLQRITPLWSQHTIERELPVPPLRVLSELKRINIVRQLHEECGCRNVSVSEWAKGVLGITRTISYQLTIVQDVNIVSTQRLVKSGDTISLETDSGYCVSGNTNFLNTHFQVLFRGSDTGMTVRGAINFDWVRDPWNKELVLSTILRMAKQYVCLLECHFSGKEFSRHDSDERWNQHKPYVLTLIILIASVLLVLALPPGTNWYRILFGAFVLFLLFVS